MFEHLFQTDKTQIETWLESHECEIIKKDVKGTSDQIIQLDVRIPKHIRALVISTLFEQIDGEFMVGLKYLEDVFIQVVKDA